jgi:hypothetical protein
MREDGFAGLLAHCFWSGRASAHEVDGVVYGGADAYNA